MSKKISTTAKIFTENLKLYRNRVNLSQADVAQRFNVAITTVSGWETGKQPSFDSLEALAELYGVRVADFFKQRDECPRIEIASEGDFVSAMRAIIESEYVLEVSAKNFEANSKSIPEFCITLFSSYTHEEDEDVIFLSKEKRTEFNKTLDLLVQMHKLKACGSLKPDMFDQVIDAAIRDLNNRR